LDQRPDGHVKGTVGFAGDALGALQNAKQILADGHGGPPERAHKRISSLVGR
jgi:hypothetical protein